MLVFGDCCWSSSETALLLFSILIVIQRLLVRRGLRPLDAIRRELPRLARGEIPQLSVTAKPKAAVEC